MNNRDKKRLFYVVQFIELPFEGIDDYVCVPYSWLIIRKPTDRRVFVAYPNKEDPFDTRDRVKRIELPNDKWRLYTALITYKSEDYKDAEYWIATRNDYGPGEEKSEIRDVQSESVLNKKLRSASQPPWSDPNSDKPQLAVKPYKNPRKPLPRISIKRPLSQSFDNNLDNKRLRFNANAEPGIDVDHEIIASGRSNQERSIIITDNQLIQNDQTKAGFASTGEINSEQSTQPGVIENSQSVYMSVQSRLKELLAEPQPSAKLSDERQISPQPPTVRQPSSKLTDGQHLSPKFPADRQPSSKLTDGQRLSPKFPAEEKLSPAGVGYQQPLSMPVIQLDECNENIDSCQNVRVEPVTEERPSTKTLPSTLELAPQAEPINERSTLLVRHEHSHSEPHPRDVFVRQSKEPDDSQKTDLNRILTAPKTIPRPSSTAKQSIQQYVNPQLPISPVSGILYSELKLQEIDERNSNKVVLNHQKPRSQGSMQSILSTSHREPKWKKLSHLSTSSTKKRIPVMKDLKNPVDKKTRLEGITKNITTMQYPQNSTMQLTLPAGSAVMQTESLAHNHLQQARVKSSVVNNVRCSMGKECVDQRELISEGMMNTSAAQNLSKLAHQYCSFVKESREQQCSSTHEDYLQQFARMQNMLRTANMARTIDQRVHHQNAMINKGFPTQSHPNPINQPIDVFPRNCNQCPPVNGAYAQGVIRHQLMKRSIDGAHTTYKPIVQNGFNIQLAAHNSSNQSHHNSKHLQQRQFPPNPENPCTANIENSLPLQSNRSSHVLEPQKVTKRPRSLSTLKTFSQAPSDAHKSYLFQEMNLQSRVNQSYTDYNNINVADVHENVTVEPVATTQDFKVQTMLSSDRQHETQSTLAQSHYVYRQPRTKKTMVDQATETDSIIDGDHYVDGIARSSVRKITPKGVDHACQTDEWLREEPGSLYQEKASDFANETESEIESDNGVMSEAYQTTLPTGQNLKPNNQEIHSRIDVEQDMLNIAGTLFTQMGANLSSSLDMFNHLRNSILVSAKTYEKLLEQVDKFNSIETLQIPTSLPNNVPSQVPQVTQERPEVDDDNNTGVGDAPTPIREQRGTFSLPAEYDPNDSKWTLKYREYKPGLIELIPRTGVYVSKKELKRLIQESTDCRTLARLLFTEVFSKNALSVCSLTGGRAKAFNSANIDVRPGLDEHARMVLLAFVEDHGNKHGWITSDTPAIMSSIRTKINEIRAKHSKTCEV